MLLLGRLKNIAILQLSIIVLSLGGIAAKKAASFGFTTMEFYSYYSLEICCIGIYALMWQQIIKRYDLSTAYSNKGSLIVWTFIWAVLIFNETITLFNIIGAIIIIAGITLVFKNAE